MRIKNHKLTIAVIIIVILSLIIAWAFLIKPQINKFIVEKQLEGYNVVIESIQQMIVQQGYAQIPNNNSDKAIVCQEVEI